MADPLCRAVRAGLKRHHNITTGVPVLLSTEKQRCVSSTFPSTSAVIMEPIHVPCFGACERARSHWKKNVGVKAKVRVRVRVRAKVRVSVRVHLTLTQDEAEGCGVWVRVTVTVTVTLIPTTNQSQGVAFPVSVFFAPTKRSDWVRARVRVRVRVRLRVRVRVRVKARVRVRVRVRVRCRDLGT